MNQATVSNNYQVGSGCSV